MSKPPQLRTIGLIRLERERGIGRLALNSTVLSVRVTYIYKLALQSRGSLVAVRGITPRRHASGLARLVRIARRVMTENPACNDAPILEPLAVVLVQRGESLFSLFKSQLNVL